MSGVRSCCTFICCDREDICMKRIQCSGQRMPEMEEKWNKEVCSDIIADFWRMHSLFMNVEEASFREFGT